MQPKYKSLVTKILIAIGIDILLSLAFIIFWQPTPDELTIEWLLLLAIFVINIGFAVASKYVIKSLYIILVLNSVIGIIIFHLLLKGWYTYQDRGISKMQFVTAGKSYELVFNKKDTSYNFYKIYNNEQPTRFMGGSYKINGDTAYLMDPVNRMMVCKDTLIGFAEKKIVLKEK